MNGLKGPNQVGKDIGFVTSLYPDMRSVAVSPDVYKEDAQQASYNGADDSCKALDKDLVVPDKNELISMYYNSKILGMPGSSYWSANMTNNNNEAWFLYFGAGNLYGGGLSTSLSVRCIKR